MSLCRIKQNMMRITLVFLLFSIVLGQAFSGSVWRAWQGLISGNIRRHYKDWPVRESEFFHIRHSGQVGEIVVWLASEADKAVRQVAEILPHETDDRKPWLVIVPDQETLKRVFGWGEGTGALGVYVADTVKILSPESWDWIEESKRLETFVRQGPLVHEYTHFVLDKQAKGNYTRWFSEGLSQLAEYKIIGYEWLEKGSSLGGDLYTLEQLDRSFDSLPNQPLAYRQALSMVSFLESLKGMEGINSLIRRLGEGETFYVALRSEYGLDRDAFMDGWRSWYSADARWLKTKSRQSAP